ncbi:MAG: hypothetical protein ACHRXM_34785 [Isosphaerales bacterium]
MDSWYHPGYPVRCAIDADTSRHIAAVFSQVRANPAGDRPRVTVFADYLALDVFSQKNACVIQAEAYVRKRNGYELLIGFCPTRSCAPYVLDVYLITVSIQPFIPESSRPSAERTPT